MHNELGHVVESALIMPRYFSHAYLAPKCHPRTAIKTHRLAKGSNPDAQCARSQRNGCLFET